MTQEQLIRNLQAPTGLVDVILDTDAYNEIDDQFAIAYLLHSQDRANTIGLTAAPFFNSRSSSPEDGMRKSYEEILKILRLAGREDLCEKTFEGSCAYLPDEKTPVDSPAARFIAETAQAYSVDRPLYVLAIGAITNVASALLIDPSIAEKIVVVWLGGHALHWYDTEEFNMKQDVAGARVLMGCGAPVVLLPCAGVVDRLATTGPELDYWLLGKNPLADYLARNAREEAESYAKGKPWSRVIWDVSTVAWLHNAEKHFMTEQLERSPIPEYDHHYGFDSRRHFIKYVSDIRRDAVFEDLFTRLTQAGSARTH